MKRSPLIQGLILVLVAILVAAYLYHRTLRIPPTVRPGPGQQPAEVPLSPSPSIKPAPSPAVSPAPAATATDARRRRSIQGRVLAADGQFLPQTTVEAFCLDPDGTLTRLYAESDKNGEYRLEIPEGALATLTAHREGLGRGFAWIDGGSTDRALHLQLRAGLSIEGVLRTADDSPVFDATLVFHPFATTTAAGDELPRTLNLLSNIAWGETAAWDERCRKELFLTDASAATDAAGKFQVGSLVGSTNYRIEILRKGRPTVVLDAYLRARKDPLVLKLPP